MTIYRAHLRTTLGEFWSPQSVEDDPNREAASHTRLATVGQEVTAPRYRYTGRRGRDPLGFFRCSRSGACRMLSAMGVRDSSPCSRHSGDEVSCRSRPAVGWEQTAFLTACYVVGYSCRTDRGFDRIRENIEVHRDEPYEMMASIAACSRRSTAAGDAVRTHLS